MLAATVAAAVWITYRSPGALLTDLRHPLRLTETRALLVGLVSSDLMVVQVVLLARLPWLERSWGRARLVRVHGLVAAWSFALLLAHVALFALQRAARDPDDVRGAMADLFWHERYLAVATVGTGLLTLVMLTSLRRVRRLLRYEWWHLAHLWSYVGLGLTLPHQLVAVDFNERRIRLWWLGLYVVALGLVLWFRLGVPVARSVHHRLRVADVVSGHGVTSVRVTGRDVEGLGVRAGQFLVWRFGGRGRTRGHPYSVSAAPGETLRVTVRDGEGDGARHVARLEPGTRVAVEGPYGHLAPLRRRHPHLLLMTAGVGVTPVRALLETEPFEPGEVTLVQRDRDRPLLGEEIDRIAEDRGVRVVRLLGPRRAPWSFLPAGVEGDAGDVLEQIAPDLLTSDVVLCGPPEWADTVRRVARAAGVRRRDLHQEDFGW